MAGCESVAGALDERRQWLAQAAEQAEQDRASAEAAVQAAKNSMKSEHDIRVGSREVQAGSPLPLLSNLNLPEVPQVQFHSRGTWKEPQAAFGRSLCSFRVHACSTAGHADWKQRCRC